MGREVARFGAIQRNVEAGMVGVRERYYIPAAPPRSSRFSGWEGEGLYAVDTHIIRFTHARTISPHVTQS